MKLSNPKPIFSNMYRVYINDKSHDIWLKNGLIDLKKTDLSEFNGNQIESIRNYLKALK